MIATIVRNGFRALRRDRGAWILSFILPVAFFSIFAFVFAGMGGNSTPRVNVLVVDEDRSASSERLVRGLRQEGSLVATTRPEVKTGEPPPPEYTTATAVAAVKSGTAPVALIIPAGFGANNHPVGLQIIGNYFSEAKMLNVAHQYQQATDWHMRMPDGIQGEG